MTKNALTIANGNPYSVAYIKGNDENKSLKGTVEFFPWSTGSIIKLEIIGLPSDSKNNFFGFHIHQNGECKIEEGKPDFEIAGKHFDDDKNTHPNHTGDLPLIYSNNGYSFMLYYTNRFTPEMVVSKSVIIHEMKDDLKTDPSGNSGKRIACGVINRRRWMFA